MINTAILGFGTIGAGVRDVLTENASLIEKKVGDKVALKRVLDLRDFPDDPVKDILTHDFNDVLNDPEIDIVIETMGGTGAAYKFVKAALEAGKSVVTSNKALVAEFGPELIELAREKSVNFMFEASVGGGIPIIRPLLHSVSGDKILEITGILNGTTNFILSKMYDEGGEFEPTLKEAKELGYAEADASADVEGHDACRKIAILTALAYERFVDFKDISCEGITKITDADIECAKKLGMKIKLLASSRLDGKKVCAEVAPCMVSKSNPLYNVDGVMNAVFVKGNMVGDLMFYGAGAGAHPTASAVISDVIVEAMHLHENVKLVMDAQKLVLEDHRDIEDRFFVRLPKGKELCGTVTEHRIDLGDEEALCLAPLSRRALDSAVSAAGGANQIIKIR